MNNVVQLPQRDTLHESAAGFMAVMRAAPEVATLLARDLPGLPKDQQRVLMAVAGFRMLGLPLPASMEMMKRLPPLIGLHEESIQANINLLIEMGVLEVYCEDKKDPDAPTSFIWSPLEEVVFEALATVSR